MLNKITFLKNILMLLEFNGVNSEEKKDEMLYEIIKDDFANEEFEIICKDILKTENLYNAYPKPKLFYDRKPAKNTQLVQGENCQIFLAKVSDYLTSDYVSSVRKEAFHNELTPIESKVLQCMGGISTLWTAVHRDDMPRSIDSILKQASQRFEECYDVAQHRDGALRLTYPVDDKVARDAQDLIGGVAGHLRVVR